MSDIKLNADEWNALSEDERSQITLILKRTGLLNPEDNIIPDPEAPPINTNKPEHPSDNISRTKSE